MALCMVMHAQAATARRLEAELVSAEAVPRRPTGALARLLPGLILVPGLCGGLAVRLRPVLEADFPLNDGALFSVMIEAIRGSGYALPESIGYNGLAIPFAYPPLALYLAALCADLARTDAISVLRLLPPVLSLCVLAAFALLAATALRTATGAAVAIVSFAFLPHSYVWLLGGGGLTRGLGLTFALLCLREVYLLATTGSSRPAARAGLFAGLTALSHLEMAWFLALSGILVYLTFGRTLASLARGSAAAVGALVVAAPWWLTILARHGLEPFLAAARTGSALELATDDPSMLPVTLGVIAFFVALALVGDEVMFLTGWLGLLALLETRALWLMAIPVSLAAGCLMGDLLAGRVLAREAGQAALWRQGSYLSRLLRPFGAVLAAALIVWFFRMTGWRVDPVRSPLVALTQEERASLAWVSANSPSSSRFLVLSGGDWARDRVAEWFPVLARRVSVATPQGTEWLPGGEFGRLLENRNAVQGCADDGPACLARWSQRTGIGFTHVYLTNSPVPCCARLDEQLRRDPSYRLVHESGAAVVFESAPPQTDAGSRAVLSPGSVCAARRCADAGDAYGLLRDTTP